jgi:hypothetical protein
VETYAGHGVQDAIRQDSAKELFVRLKGNYVACPVCILREQLVTPIRQGQLVRMRAACWEIIRRRAVDEAEPAEVVAVVAAREVILERHDDRARSAHAREQSIATRDYRANARPAGRHQRHWDEGRQANDQSDLVYAVAWASAGAARGLPKLCSIPPWEPYDPWDLPQYDWSIFPPGFAAE